MKPRLLDLFCGGGGAAKGYQRAGFYVVGVDIKPQPHYCGDEFHQADAMTYPLDGFDAIHASPPCQKFSRLTRGLKKGETKELDLIADVRKLLKATCNPYVIENVQGSPLDANFLCGSSFGLELWRHRYFETVPMMLFPMCRHDLVKEPWGVFSRGGGGWITQKRIARGNKAKEVMAMPWATQQEIGQAVPPAYTEFIGKQLMEILVSRSLEDAQEG